MAVNRRRTHFGADLIKLVTESAHVAGVVFIAGDDLVNRVDDHGGELLVLHAPDQYGNQPVQRQGMPAQVPDDDVVRVWRRKAQLAVDRDEAVDARRRVDLQIHIQDSALGTRETQPCASLGDGDRQFNEQEALARLARPGDQHLVSAAQDATNQLGRLRRRGFHVAQADRLGQQRQLLSVLQPLAPCVLADMGGQQFLRDAVSRYAGHPAQAGRVFVGVVHGKPALLQKAEQIVDAVSVLLLVRGVDAHEGVHTLARGIHEAGDRQLVFPIDPLLLFLGQCIRLDEHMAVRDHVPVGLALAVQRIEPDPRAAVRAVGADHGFNAFGVAQPIDELGRLHGEIGVDGLELAVVVGLDLRGISDKLVRLKHGFQIADERLRGRKLPRVLKIRKGGNPAVLSCHGANGANGDGAIAALEGRPAPGAVALDIALIVPGPVIPHGTLISGVLERHADTEPLRVGARPNRNTGKRGENLIHLGVPPYPL